MSIATQPFTEADLEALLTRCRARNQAQGLTGLLLYKSLTFMQALEGEQSVVEATYERIKADKRHTSHMVLCTEPIGERRFPDWLMGYHNLDRTAAPAGYSTFMNTPDETEDSDARASRAHRFLQHFRQTPKQTPNHPPKLTR